MRDAVGAWLDSAGRYPLLTAAEELHLGAMVQAWQQWPGGPDTAPAPVRRRGLRARDRMVTANLRLVVAVAKRYQRYAALRAVEFEDLLQAGAMGLQRGIEKFDPARGYKLSTYSYWWIRQSLPREIWRGGAIKIPQGVGERLQRLRAQDLDSLSAADRATLEAGMAALNVVALDAPAGGGEAAPLSEFLAADGVDQLEALGDEIEAERLQAAAPEAWADGVAAVSSRCGLRSARGRRILDALRAA